MTKKKKIIITVSGIMAVILVTAAILGGLYLFGDPSRDMPENYSSTAPFETVLTKAQAQQDFEHLKTQIEKKHYSAVSGLPDKFKAVYEEEYAKLTDRNTMLSVWRAAKRMLNTLGDAHSAMGYANDETAPFYAHGQNIIIDNDGKFFIEITGEFYPLLKIGGVAVSEFKEGAKQYFSYENDYWFYDTLERSLRYAETLAGAGLDYNNESITFEYSDGGLKELTVSYVPETFEVTQSEPPPFIRYEIDELQSWGKLTVDACVYDDFYVNTLKDFFAEVKNKNIKNVSVDLSENGGGSSMVANEFLRYINISEYKDFGINVRWGVYNFQSKPNTRKNNIYKDLAFSGKLFVITSRKTFSSAMMFAAYLYDNELAAVVGAPIGNSPTSYGDILRYQLPNSKLLLQTTYKYFIRPDGEKVEKTIVPDYMTNEPYEKIKELLDL